MEKTTPEILETLREGDKVTLRLRVPAELDYFKGHFTGAPILPGVVQLHWAVHFTQEYFGRDITPSQVAQLKFKQLILPDMEVVLALEFSADASRICFGFSSKLGDNASGIIKL